LGTVHSIIRVIAIAGQNQDLSVVGPIGIKNGALRRTQRCAINAGQSRFIQDREIGASNRALRMARHQADTAKKAARRAARE
jgi:hypothetical protein